MRPGQLHPNEFEVAILQGFAQREPAILSSIDALHVLSREFTGVGSFTRFQYEGAESERHLTLAAEIHVPGVPTGLGAVLFCRGDHPISLELFTYGDQFWDGVSDGYAIIQPPNQSLQPTTGRSDV
jgi:hypothetical protein